MAADARPVYALAGSPSLLGVAFSWICLGEPPTSLDRDFHHPADLLFLRHPIVSLSPPKWYRNINLFSIAYAVRPRLRIRLTLSGLTFLRKPWVFGERVSHPFSRYSCPHKHFQDLHPSFPSGFAGYWNAPLPLATLGSVANPWLRYHA